jgi:hypothetical protein
VITTSGARLALVALALLLVAGDVGAQTTYNRGRNVAPAFEGWLETADGTRSFVFGYMNQNWEEELDVPVGPDNTIEPGGPDLGQPTHFQPRRNRFVFMVPVPKSFKETDELLWKLTTRGKQAIAYATLRPDYKLDDQIIASETGSTGGGITDATTRANKAPTLSLAGDRHLTVKVGQPLTLVATVADDGVPRRGQGGAPVTRPRPPATTPSATPPVNPVYVPPARPVPGKFNALYVAWFVYRGSGEVSFDPEQVVLWEDSRTGANSPWAPLWQPPTGGPDGQWTTRATFSRPGTFVLRARADDGALYADQDVTVTVVP